MFDVDCMTKTIALLAVMPHMNDMSKLTVVGMSKKVGAS
jgi:hypothetical protein